MQDSDPFARRSRLARSPADAIERSPTRESQRSADARRSSGRSPVRVTRASSPTPVKSPPRNKSPTRGKSPKKLSNKNPAKPAAPVASSHDEKPVISRAELMKSVSLNLESLNDVVAAPLVKTKVAIAKTSNVETKAPKLESTLKDVVKTRAVAEPAVEEVVEQKPQVEETLPSPPYETTAAKSEDVPVREKKRMSRLNASVLLGGRRASKTTPAPAVVVAPVALKRAPSPVPTRRSSRGKNHGVASTSTTARSTRPSRSRSRSRSPVPRAASKISASSTLVHSNNENVNPFQPLKRLQRSPDAGEPLQGQSGMEMGAVACEESVADRSLGERALESFMDSSLLKETSRDDSANNVLVVGHAESDDDREDDDKEEAPLRARALLPGEFRQYLQAFRSPRRKLRRSSMSKGLYLELEQAHALEEAARAVEAAQEARREMDRSLSLGSRTDEAVDDVDMSANVSTSDPFAPKQRLAHSPVIMPNPSGVARDHDPPMLKDAHERAHAQIQGMSPNENIPPAQLASPPPVAPAHGREVLAEVAIAQPPGEEESVDVHDTEHVVPKECDASMHAGMQQPGLDVPVAAPVLVSLQNEVIRLQAEMAYRLATTTQDRILQEAREERDSIKTWLTSFEQKMEEKKIEKDREQEFLRARVLDADIEAAKAVVNCLAVESQLIQERQRTRVSKWALLSHDAMCAPSSSGAGASAAGGSYHGGLPPMTAGAYEGMDMCMGSGGFHDDDVGGFDDYGSHVDDFTAAASTGLLSDASSTEKKSKKKSQKQKQARKRREVGGDDEADDDYVFVPAPPPQVKGMKFVALDLPPPPPRRPYVPRHASDVPRIGDESELSQASPPRKTAAKPKAVSKPKGKPKGKAPAKPKAKTATTKSGKAKVSTAAVRAVKGSKKAKKEAGAATETKAKRAPSAYIRFSSSIRAEVKAENPTLTFGDIAREISRRWKDLTESEKAEFAPDVIGAVSVTATASSGKKGASKATKAKASVAKKAGAKTKKKGKTKTTSEKLVRLSDAAALERFRAVSEGEVREAQVGASEADVEKLVLMMWQVATEEEREPYMWGPAPKKQAPRKKKKGVEGEGDSVASNVALGATEIEMDVPMESGAVVDTPDAVNVDITGTGSAIKGSPLPTNIVSNDADADAATKEDIDVTAETIKLNASAMSMTSSTRDDGDETVPLDDTKEEEDDEKEDSNFVDEDEASAADDGDAMDVAPAPSASKRLSTAQKAQRKSVQKEPESEPTLDEILAPLTASKSTHQRKKLFSFGGSMGAGAGPPRLSVLGSPDRTPDASDKENPAGDGRKSRLSSARRKSGVKNSAIKSSASKPSLFNALSYATSYQAGMAAPTLSLKNKLQNPKVSLKPGFQQQLQQAEGADNDVGEML